MVDAVNSVAEELRRRSNKTMHAWRDYESAVNAEYSTIAQYEALLSIIVEFAGDAEPADRGATEQAGDRERGGSRLFGWLRRAQPTPGRVLERIDEAGERDVSVPIRNVITAQSGLDDERTEETDQQPDDEAGASQSRLGRSNGEPAKHRAGVVTADLVLHLLGPVRVLLDDRPITALPRGQSLRVMTYVLAHYDRPVPVEVLIETFWPGSSVEAGRRNLQQAVYVLRKTLRADRHEQSVLFENDAYLVNPALNVWSDVTAFERSAASGRRAENEGRLAHALDDLTLAERCYEGDYLEDSPYEEWAIEERERLRLLYVDVANHLAELHLAANDLAATLAVSRRVLRREPCDENAHRRIMCYYAAAGRRNMLIRQYRQCVASLETTYGVGPSPETIRLYESLTAD
jgi:DNA-binding SARP family transcriptional activator